MVLIASAALSACGGPTGPSTSQTSPPAATTSGCVNAFLSRPAETRGETTPEEALRAFVTANPLGQAADAWSFTEKTDSTATAQAGGATVRLAQSPAGGWAVLSTTVCR